MRIIAICVFLSVLAPATFGASPAKTQVNGRDVSSPSVGFKGMTLRLPDGWARYAPIENTNLHTTDPAQRAWRMATDSSGAPGYRTEEIVTFRKAHLAVALTIAVLANNEIPSERFDPTGHGQFLGFLARDWRFPKGQVFIRRVEKIGKRSFVKVGRTLSLEVPIANLVYIAVVPPSSELVFNGVTTQSALPELEAAMNLIIESMVTDKR